MANRKTIVILEDDNRRRAEMFRWLDDRLWMYDAKFFRTAKEIKDWLETNWDGVLVVSLDHDLTDLPSTAQSLRQSAGDGREVVDALVLLGQRRDLFPVLIHSTNTPASHAMVEKLREANKNWRVDRIAPYDDLEWIEKDWYPTLKRMIPVSSQMPQTKAEI